MLCSVNALDGFRLAALDGEIGHAREAYFDEARWGIRHIVADTGGWMTSHKVLISPHAIRGIDLAHRKLDVALSRRQLADAPGVQPDQPLSRQHEIPYYDYYGYPYYWFGAGVWGLESLPLAGEALARRPDEPQPGNAADPEPGDAGAPHLRSTAEVIGYDVDASDGAIGHVDDFLFDDRSWQIRFVVVDTRNWLPGRLVLLSPHSIAEIDWGRRRVRFHVARNAVKASPPYFAGTQLSADEERHLQRHYEGWQ